MFFLALLVPPLLMGALIGLARYEEYMLGPAGGSRPAPEPQRADDRHRSPGRGRRRARRRGAPVPVRARLRPPAGRHRSLDPRP
ncbi:hypothetical protein ABZ743_08655 [Streptomyces sp. NPDC006662]|uniref:hypothetical protein n=1 Tax=Streptomyces sp. NPDC006662 TaxID=3156902 RepID=UPI0033DC0C49